MLKLETPCILIDLDIMEKNIQRMADIAKRNGVSLRPHVKTHKIPEIAHRQLAAGASGITVAKVSEAEVMATHGITDIFIAYPVIGEGKIRRALDLHAKIRLILGIDSLEGAEALARAASSRGETVEVRLEVDTGLRRTGIPYDKVLEIAGKIAEWKGIRITGIYTFKGLVFQGKSTLDRRQAGLEEGRLMVELAEEMKKLGLDIRDVSVGSTPTAEFAATVPGVTETRPGTYVFNDMMQVRAGSSSLEDCAARILTTVISRPQADLGIIDGGTKTFAGDAAPGKAPYYFKGYGQVVEYPDLVLERLTEEHGMISLPEKGEEPRIGQRITVIPNHICPVINLQDKVYFVKQGETVKEVAVAARGRVY
ncbi:MAG: alanine racemase [Clostridia bacterium]|jgi:D-serine deaminase-like pyridoxal phosphate-dependent protein